LFWRKICRVAYKFYDKTVYVIITNNTFKELARMLPQTLKEKQRRFDKPTLLVEVAG